MNEPETTATSTQEACSLHEVGRVLTKEWMRRADAAWKDYEQTDGIASRGHREKARAYEAAVRDLESEIEKHPTEKGQR